MQILHVSDIHFRVQYEAAQDGYASVLYRMTNPLILLDRCLEQAFSEHPGIGLLMITGDLCDDGGAADYEALRAYLERSLRGIPMVVTTGNHDRKDEFRRGWLGLTAENGAENNLPYNTCWSGAELDVLSLDSAVFGESNGRFVDGQAQWLAGELERGDKPALLITHHHFVDAHEEIRAVECPQEIARLVKESRITAVMAGHTHHCFAGYWQEKPYYTSDGMSFYGINRADGSVHFEEKYGYNYYETNQGMVTASEQRTFSENRELANIIFSK